MPNPSQAKSKSVNTEPSDSLIQRLIGGKPMPDNIKQGMDIARKENPNLAPVNQFNFIQRMLDGGSGNLAITEPNRQIYINPSANIGQSPEDIASTLVHENEHVNQMKTRGHGPIMESIHELMSGINEPYHRRPDEMGAYQAEADRKFKLGLPPAPRPSFATGQFTPAQDIELRGIQPSPQMMTKMGVR